MRSFPTSYEASGSHIMRAIKALQKGPGGALGSTHSLRSRVSLHAVEATVHDGRLTLIDFDARVARRGIHSSAAEGTGRLLADTQLHAECE